jgi:hypothetical protein
MQQMSNPDAQHLLLYALRKGDGAANKLRRGVNLKSFIPDPTFQSFCIRLLDLPLKI